MLSLLQTQFSEKARSEDTYHPWAALPEEGSGSGCPPTRTPQLRRGPREPPGFGKARFATTAQFNVQVGARPSL